jgi:hypothetical protein
MRSVFPVRRVSCAFLCAAIIGLAVMPLASQSASSAIPRTPDGRPDLQGTYTHGTLTPFERPVALGEKAVYTEAEFKDVQAQAAARRNNPRPALPGDVGNDNEAFVDGDYFYLSTRQTSLVVDPPDGRLPFRPEVEAIREFNLRNRDDYETMSPWDRCITRSATIMLPGGYNNGTQIVQTRDYVVISSETIHEARVVPLDGRPHAPAAVRSWTGDPRGRWEGDTLVIDSTNFIDTSWLAANAGAGRLRATPVGPNLHIVERFTPMGREAVRYDITVEDSKTFTRPWTASFLLNRDDSYQIYEYACHEGNAAIELVLRGARSEEKRGGAAGPR